MSPIQALLIGGALASFVLYFVYLRTALRERAIALLLLAMAVGAILFPDATTLVANALGVGRGTDLIIYLVATGTVFGFVLTATRLRRTERMLIEVVRHLALAQARRPAPEPPSRPAA